MDVLFVIPAIVLAFAFLVNGFPNIHIGSKNYYDKDGKKKN
jgi:hypothetical protein